MDEWQKRDLAHIWHPCSQMKDYETLPPIVIDHGKGIWLTDKNGKDYMDVVSSWWCNLLGHCHPTISAAMKEQLDRLDKACKAEVSNMKDIVAEIVPTYKQKIEV